MIYGCTCLRLRCQVSYLCADNVVISMQITTSVDIDQQVITIAWGPGLNNIDKKGGVSHACHMLVTWTA